MTRRGGASGGTSWRPRGRGVWAARVPGHEEEGGGGERGDFFVSEWEEGLSREDVEDLGLDDPELTVAEIMTPEVFAVREETPVSEIAEAMIENHVHRLLVTREDRVVGASGTAGRGG